MLGYRIERVRKFDEQGDVEAQWYEVMAPDDCTLLGSYAQRSLAERAIVARELAAVPCRVAA